jgi:hypothetical protein
MGVVFPHSRKLTVASVRMRWLALREHKIRKVLNTLGRIWFSIIRS